MALIFSKVSVTAAQETMTFLVGGAPRSVQDLVGWTMFDQFVVKAKNAPISVKVDVRRYGGEEDYAATPEEVAYMYMRLERQADFIEDRTTQVETSEFTIEV